MSKEQNRIKRIFENTITIKSPEQFQELQKRVLGFDSKVDAINSEVEQGNQEKYINIIKNINPDISISAATCLNNGDIVSGDRTGKIYQWHKEESGEYHSELIVPHGTSSISFLKSFADNDFLSVEESGTTRRWHREQNGRYYYYIIDTKFKKSTN